jgi:sugar fermentation stimulation protein A
MMNWAGGSPHKLRHEPLPRRRIGGLSATMRFDSALIPATLTRRYKRFLADVVLDNGDIATVHVANPGAMTGLDRPLSRVWLSDSRNPLRKYPCTWELVETDLGNGPELVGVNTGQPHQLVAEAIEAGLIPELRNYPSVRREVKYGEKSRVDFLLEDPAREACYLEVKNVHLMRAPHLAEFPDCVTDRGARHMRELAQVRAGGARAVLLFVIQIPSATRFALARDIDPAYGSAFDQAREAGVEMLAWRCNISLGGIEIAAPVPIVGG